MIDNQQEEYHVLPFSFDGLVNQFRGTGLSANIFVLYIDQTSYIDDRDIDETLEPYTGGTFYVSHIQVHNGNVSTQVPFMCMEFGVPGDQLNNFSIEDFARMIGTVQTPYPWCDVRREPLREQEFNHWIFDSFNSGITDNLDYYYDQFVTYEDSLIIFSGHNLSDNLISY